MKHRLTSLLVTSALALGSTACGSSDEDAGQVDDGNDPPNVMNDDGDMPPDTDPVEPDPMAEEENLDCGLDTQWLGDENCILPPHPDEGVQFHVGPSSYDDPDVYAATDENGDYLWLLEPGGENTDCYHLIAENPEDRFYFEQKYRMRYGSHHMIIMNSQSAGTEEGWNLCDTSIVGAIGGTQSIIEDVPPGGAIPPEDEGLGRLLVANAPLDFSLHFYNVTNEVTMRETWVNFYYKPADEVTHNLGMLGGFARIDVPPGTTATTGNECTMEQAIKDPTVAAPEDPVRVVTLFGHAHTHNTRFAVWHDKVDGSEELVYDSYEGAEAPTFTYNTAVQNPVPDPVNRVTGARSGILMLNPGEQLRFACDITNDTNLRFTGANEVNTDEMCNLFGTAVAAGFPCFNLSVLGQ